MPVTSAEKELHIEVEKDLKLNIAKIWGTLEVSHRGQKLMGGMTWEPENKISVVYPHKGELSLEGVKELFSDLIDTLMPSVRVLVDWVDEKDADF